MGTLVLSLTSTRMPGAASWPNSPSSSPGNAPTVRANIFALSGFTTLFSGVTYGAAGLFTGDRVLLSLPLLAVYAVAMWIGARGFRYSTDAGFRRAALALCAVAGVAGLPIW